MAVSEGYRVIGKLQDENFSALLCFIKEPFLHILLVHFSIEGGEVHDAPLHLIDVKSYRWGTQ
jgi:hypothetical protein